MVIVKIDFIEGKNMILLFLFNSEIKRKRVAWILPEGRSRGTEKWSSMQLMSMECFLFLLF